MTLPPLPTPAVPATPVYYPTSYVTLVGQTGPKYQPLFSASQMRAYATAAVAAEREAHSGDAGQDARSVAVDID
jgi:hypothetical protein